MKKRCSRCGEVKSPDSFGKDKHTPDGLTCACSACRSATQRQRRAAGAWRETEAAWRRSNPEKCEAYTRKWRAANPERVRASQSAYRTANPDKNRDAARRRRVLNPVKDAEYQKAWREDNRERMRAHYALRRAREAGTATERINPTAIFERDGWTCYICGRPAPRELQGTRNPLMPTLDHIKPLAKGGTHTFGNVACAHWSCNASKGTRPWFECSALLA